MDGKIGAYFNSKFVELIDPSLVKTIFELGAGDGLDAIKLSEFYDADVCGFECNANLLEICTDRILDFDRVRLEPQAVWSETKIIPYYPVTNGNDSASSCFIAADAYPYENYMQEETTVEAIALMDFIESTDIKPDMLCIDLQGAEEHALIGMGQYLEDVKYIITEGQNSCMYHGASTIFDIGHLLTQCGFVMKHSEPVNEWYGDYLFVNEEKVN